MSRGDQAAIAADAAAPAPPRTRQGVPTAASPAPPALDSGPGASTRVAGRGALFVWIWAGMLLVWVALSLSHGERSWLAIALAGLPLAAVYAAFCLSAEYLCRLFPLRPGRLLAPALHQLEAAIALAFLWTLLARGLRELLAAAGRAAWTASLLSAPALLFIAGVLLYLIAGAAFYTAQAHGRAAEAQRLADEARLEAREAELRALRSQVNPHFLFNCLHSISALTALDPARAREMCVHLAELFRLTLRTGQREMVTLAEELAVVRAYLAVEQVRFGARMRLEEAIDPAALPCPVPALLLQPLVENAVKHGIAGLTRPGELRVAAALPGALLRVEISNDYDPESVAPERNGIGLPQVRRRLATHYGSLGRLEWSAEGGRFQVRLEIPAASQAS